MTFQQTILMKYHALFVIFEKAAKLQSRLLQIISGALRDSLPSALRDGACDTCLLFCSSYQLCFVFFLQKNNHTISICNDKTVCQ